MPKEYRLKKKFVYNFFIEKGIPPREVDEMYQEDVDYILLINSFINEKRESERRKQELKHQSMMRK